jgi:O-antigen/teichoic acid export membrane protein
VKALLQRIWQQRRSPELWLLASNLLSRLLGFVVSLLLSRTVGVQALGVYSGLLITSASPTTPMSAVLANNATMLAARHHPAASLMALLRANAGVFAWSALLAGAGCWAMLGASTLTGSGLVSPAAVLVVVSGLVLGQLLTQLVVGLCHGADLSRQASMVVSAAMLASLLMAYPILKLFGLAGVLLQAMAVAVAPGLVLSAWLWRRRGARQDSPALRSETTRYFRQALPNVLATVVNNATNWVSCIYLAEKFHGHGGLGLVAISLQWMALMQLPVTSWGGRVMRALALAHGQSSSAFKGEIRQQLRKCAGVSVVAALVVLALAVPVADLYKVDRHLLACMFAINALATALASINFVYERVFFCLGSQRPWLLISVLAYLAQLALTLVLVPHSVLAVAAGNLMAIVVVMVVVSGYFFHTLRRAGGTL